MNNTNNLIYNNIITSIFFTTFLSERLYYYCFYKKKKKELLNLSYPINKNLYNPLNTNYTSTSIPHQTSDILNSPSMSPNVLNTSPSSLCTDILNTNITNYTLDNTLDNTLDYNIHTTSNTKL